MKAREADQVHLLLCDALFQFQAIRSPTCHAHLEQPSGSQMLYQEEMTAILEQSIIGRCDMCRAGSLKHPVSLLLPLQKGTQIVTTSQVMYRRIETLQCDKPHQHDVVAGSCRIPNQRRMPVSQFTELYAQAFAEKVIRCMLCSQKVHERKRLPVNVPWSPDLLIMQRKPTPLR